MQAEADQQFSSMPYHRRYWRIRSRCTQVSYGRDRGSVEEIAASVVFLASDSASFINGVNLRIVFVDLFAQNVILTSVSPEPASAIIGNRSNYATDSIHVSDWQVEWSKIPTPLLGLYSRVMY
eukprot:UN21383